MFELIKSFKDYKFPHTIHQFKELPLAIKYRFQRAFRGWADYDVLSMNTWFMEVIPQMLQYQRDCKVSTPVFDVDASHEENREKWDQILDKMIFLCQEMNEDTCSKKMKKNLMMKCGGSVSRKLINIVSSVLNHFLNILQNISIAYGSKL